MKIISGAAFLILICTGSLFSQNDPFKTAIDSLFREHYSDTSVGVSIGVVYYNPNTNEYLRRLFYYGEKNRATHEAPDSNTVYQIGSVTKTFTAMVMAHMLRYNMSSRWDLIENYLPDTLRVPYWVNGNDTTRINLLELVTHFSGLVDEPPGTSYPYTLNRMFRYLDTCNLVTKPDSLWTYSNLGFATLATGLTMHAGRDSIEQLFQQFITDSLGMPDTKITRTLSMILRSAKGYVKNNSGVWVAADSNKSTWPAFDGAGAIRSTIKDMTRYLEYQMKLLNSSLNPLLDTMHKHIKRINPGQPTQRWQGMAWASNRLNFQLNNPWIQFKDGGTPGYNSFITFYNDSLTGVKGGVVILSNSGSSQTFNNPAYIEALSMNILTYLHTEHTSIGIEPINNIIPKTFSLRQNYPNPFNPKTVINFSVPQASNVKLSVFDAAGGEISVLINSELKAGVYEINWNAENLPSGAYFCKLSSGKYTETIKMVLIK
ncbi:MAG TPA: serine hydrolase [Ignavibacteria bacterium]|nr:serine hydrolase [Ignavibacteria bacterium]